MLIPHKVLFWLSLSIVIIVPFSNDSFIAAFPIMSHIFHTQHIALVIGVFLAGLGLGQPFYGPFSDRFGRKPVLLVGLTIYCLGSAVTLVAPTLPIFLTARFLQAIGACSAIISVFAIIRDTYSDNEFIKAMATIMTVIGVCPAIAPLWGAYLTNHGGWKANFIFLFLCGLFYLVLIACCFKETQKQKNLSALNVKKMLHNYRILFCDPIYNTYCIASALSYGALFAYLSVVPFYAAHQLHLSMLLMGWLVFGLGAIIFITSLLVPRIIQRLGLPIVLCIGCGILVGGSFTMLLSLLIWGANPYSFFLPMAIVICGIGCIRPVGAAGAIAQAPSHISGSASSGFNFVIFVCGACCSSISGHFTANPIYYAIFAITVGCIALMISLANHKRILRTA